MIRLSLFTFALYSSFSVVSFYLPLYLKYKSFSNSEIGLIMACGAMITIIGQPFWGLVSDRKNTIKKVLIFILCMGIVCSIPLFHFNSLPLMILSIMLFMFFFNSSGPLTDSLTIKYAFENNKSYGTIRLWGEIGVGASALLIGIAIEKIGMAYLNWMYIILVLFALANMYKLEDAKTLSIPVTLDSLKRLFTNRIFLLFLFIMLLIATPHRMNDILLSLYLDELGAPESAVGMAWVVATASAAVAFAFTGYLLRFRSELFLLVTAAIFYSLRWATYGYISTPTGIIIGQVFHLLTFPVMLAAALQFVYKIVPPELKSTGQTTFTAVFFGIGGIIGNAGGGRLMDLIGAANVYYVGSLLCFIGAIFLIASARFLRSHAKEQGTT